MEKTLDDVEKDIDAALHSLPIFRLPLNIALIDCLTVYESQMLEAGDIRQVFSHDAAIVHIKRSIETLIPKLYNNCPPSYSFTFPKNTVLFPQTRRRQNLPIFRRNAIS